MSTSSISRKRLIRDPIYGYITVPSRLEPFLSHPLFQRLRRVGQTSLTQTVYPASTHTRFEHSLGTMYLARRACLAALSNASTPARKAFFEAIDRDNFPLPGSDREETVADALACVGLLHDLGHPPYSHILERDLHANLAAWITPAELPVRWETLAAVKCPFHEFAGSVLLDQVVTDLGGKVDASFLALVQHVYEADPDTRTWAGALHSVVASEVDVDRLDYLMRDGQRAGTEFGAIDYQRLVDAFECISPGRRRGAGVFAGPRRPGSVCGRDDANSACSKLSLDLFPP